MQPLKCRFGCSSRCLSGYHVSHGSIKIIVLVALFPFVFFSVILSPFILIAPKHHLLTHQDSHNPSLFKLEVFNLFIVDFNFFVFVVATVLLESILMTVRKTI